MRITVITPTGDRQETFKLCELFYSRQTVKPDQWIVVDDGRAPTDMTMGQTYIRRLPCVTKHTIRDNMLAALPYIEGDQIIMMEDDDWYHPDYIKDMSSDLKMASLVGHRFIIYYNIPHHSVYTNINTGHSALCYTGFNFDMVKHVEHCAKNPSDNYRFEYLDKQIWKTAQCNKIVSRGPYRCIGMKGLPGRTGSMMGHQNLKGFKPDHKLAILKDLIGEDVKLYEKWLDVSA